MKRLVLGLSAAIILAGCSTQTTVRYTLTFNVTDSNVQDSLAFASQRVAERRLEHLNEQIISDTIDTSKKPFTLSITVPDKGAADELTKELTAPFSLQVMAQTGTGETADIMVQGQGSFRKTGITEKDLTGVVSHKDADGKGEVALLLTPDGQAKMQDLFKQTVGRNIGIFVREGGSKDYQLVSKLHVQTTVAPDNIVISNIPSSDLADVFADDMNVGLHVTFTPVP
ncbi:MAG TPA: lipoprotein [Candidatus Peribacteraceae bacterium]|nr:lipoprotein [Candidatus Peribacteraceae bacterium]